MNILINAITISRILLALSVFITDVPIWMLGITLWAAVSDFLDGYLARAYNLTSKFGAQLDQIADKIFQFCLLYWLWSLSVIHLTFATLFLGREVAILALRHYNLSVSHSNFLGKVKTAVAYVFIIVVILEMNFNLLSNHVFDGTVILFEVSLIIMTYYSLILSLNLKKEISE